MSPSSNDRLRRKPACETDLAAAFHEGNREAVRNVGAWIERIVRYRSWRFRDPDNVIQEVTLRLLKLVRAGKFRGDSAFRTFVHSVATHVCIDTYRREKRLSARETAEDDLDLAPGSGADPERELAQRERARLLSYLYQRLSQDCRDLWRWVYFEQRRGAEVAKKLGITENAARVRVHRCLERARGLLDKMQTGLAPGHKATVP